MKYFIILLFAALGFSLTNCDNTTSTVKTESAQIVFIYAQHNTVYWDEENYTVTPRANTEAFGVLFADPLPEFEYFVAGDSIIRGGDKIEYLPGYIIFGLTDDFEFRIFDNLSPLKVEVKTSAGKLNGEISLPDSFVSINLSEKDTLQLGQPFTISWQGGSADFYSVSCNYEWLDENRNWQYTDLDTFVTGNSITYPGSVFNHSGRISYISIQAMNGPFPNPGARGNMTGDGSGFLYYMIDDKSPEDDTVIVGFGLIDKSSLGKQSSHKMQGRNKVSVQEKIRNIITGI